MLFVFTTPSRLFRLLYPPSLPPNLTLAMEAVDRLELLQSQAVCRSENGGGAGTVRTPLRDDHRLRLGVRTGNSSLIRECQGSAEVGVNHQPEPRKASTGTRRSSIKRSHKCTRSWRG